VTSVRCVISAADHAGWAHFVCVAAPGQVPAVIERRRVNTIVAGYRQCRITTNRSR
jgi:hypothetical protein